MFHQKVIKALGELVKKKVKREDKQNIHFIEKDLERQIEDIKSDEQIGAFILNFFESVGKILYQINLFRFMKNEFCHILKT